MFEGTRGLPCDGEPITATWRYNAREGLVTPEDELAAALMTFESLANWSAPGGQTGAFGEQLCDHLGL
jgi:hypothetical protein